MLGHTVVPSIARIVQNSSLSHVTRSISSPNPERKKTAVPSFVTDRLKEMQIEIASQFVADIPPPSSVYQPTSRLPTTSEDFTRSLERMAKYYFDQGGKMFRPTVALLVASACNEAAPKSVRYRLECGSDEISVNQYKIGMIAEMIHTASLVHDDVIDGADTRRGNASVNALWGNKMAVLVGDFILARATQVLCSIGRPNVISVMASIIEDLVMGEFMQMTAKGETNEMDDYMTKTYKKTASLFSNSCRSVAILAEADDDLQLRASEYGRHLGLAFQLVDDLLDFVSSASDMGKPVATDLKLGLSTAPVIFAAQQHPELKTLMSRKFSEPGDPDKARQIVLSSEGIEKTRSLAKEHSQQAARLAATLPNQSGVADILVDYALSQLERRS